MTKKGRGRRTTLQSGWMILKRIGLIPRFMKDPTVSLFKKLMVILGIVYVISPIDIISDPILGFGFIDDALLITYIVSKISSELDRYIIKEEPPFEKDKMIDDVEYKVDKK